MRISGGSGLADFGYATNNESVAKKAAAASGGDMDVGPSIMRMEGVAQTSESASEESGEKGGLDFFKTAFNALSGGVRAVGDFFKGLFAPNSGGSDQTAAGAAGENIGKGIVDFLKTAVSALGTGLGMAVDLLKKVI
ncbi:hypothetical protein [Pseudomonas sp. TH31]|uniref:hypothetical protein n=1 Tax=Pseudomonas sp. TH31 TaxID=2796396 RepID=UPI0019133CF4|nr:hypothetical protein [Pseudomonas sp. TH31]MBK5415380.1 hypothetical protein [Pseudomonas sp. TH31]